MTQAGTLDRPPGRAWFDRRSFLPAAVLVLLVVALVAVPRWLNTVVPERTRPVTDGETVTLQADGQAVTVTPIAGWELVNPGTEQALQLRRDGASISVEVAAAVSDLDRFYRRHARQLRTAGLAVLPGTPTSTGAGFAGLTGTAVVDDRTGQVSVLARGDTMLVVLSLAEPGQLAQVQPQVQEMLDTVQEGP